MESNAEVNETRKIDANDIFNDFGCVNREVSGFCALNLLVWSNCKEQTLETSHSTMSENRPMVQLCAQIAADRDHVCPNFYIEMIPARIMNMLSRRNSENMVPSYRSSPLKKLFRSDYLGSP